MDEANAIRKINTQNGLTPIAWIKHLKTNNILFFTSKRAGVNMNTILISNEQYSTVTRMSITLTFIYTTWLQQTTYCLHYRHMFEFLSFHLSFHWQKKYSIKNIINNRTFIMGSCIRKTERIQTGGHIFQLYCANNIWYHKMNMLLLNKRDCGTMSPCLNFSFIDRVACQLLKLSKLHCGIPSYFLCLGVLHATIIVCVWLFSLHCIILHYNTLSCCTL